ncbi:MAG: FtsW/RodA/SpoVE family cell cycle protein, partial [Patescibacteria group bacterium]
TTGLILLFILFLWLGIKIARKANDKFSKLTAVGITFLITFQAFLNITSTIGLFPISGLPLPFFSYGGSHIIAELIGVGILLNISKNG